MGRENRVNNLRVFILFLFAMVLGVVPDLLAIHAPGNPEAGKDIFMESCQHCHGPSARGDGQMAEYLDPRPKDLTSASTRSMTDDQIRKVIIVGRKGTAMAGFEDAFEDAQLIDLVAYIRSLKP